MKILIYGDIIGRHARQYVFEKTKQIRLEKDIDFVIADADNVAHGFGITSKLAKEFFATGTDVITTGNHVWDQKEVIPYLDTEPKILRALNYPEGTVGNGFGIYETSKGQKIAVVHLLGSAFMNPIDNPFTTMETFLKKHKLKNNLDAIIVDFHAEITSEKNAFGHFCDGKVSGVVGTHTHIPTADYRVLENGTAYVTDIGMCGDYNSVIGMDKKEPISRFLTGKKTVKFEPATGKPTLHAVIITTDDETGLAINIEKIVI